MNLQKCNKCGQEKPLKDFPLDKRDPNKKRRRRVCATCVKSDYSKSDTAFRKGRKIGVPWDEDPEILLLLETVDILLTRGAKTFQIAAHLQCDWGTAKKYIGHVIELRQRTAAAPINQRRNDSVATYERIKTELWFMSNGITDHKTKIALLQNIREAQRRIDEVDGRNAPKQIDVGVHLSPEAMKALERLEAAGVPRDRIFSELEKFVIEEAARVQ